MELFLKGTVMGFCIAAPVGPIGLLCIRRSMAEGQLAGFVCGLGAATADALYGFVAALGLTAVTVFLVDHRTPLQVLGGLFLVYVGLTLVRAPRTEEKAIVTRGRSLASAYGTTFALTLANPVTILAFIGIFAGLGVSNAVTGIVPGGILVAGVFFGSAAWWLILSASASWLGARFHPDRLHVLNVISGSLITAFGVWQSAAPLLAD